MDKISTHGKSNDWYCGFCDFKQQCGDEICCGCENSKYYKQPVEYVNCIYYKTSEGGFSELNQRNPKIAFQNAMQKGMNNPGDWMYMYSDHCYDHFKHHMTRDYKKVRFAPWYKIIQGILKSLFCIFNKGEKK